MKKPVIPAMPGRRLALLAAGALGLALLYRPMARSSEAPVLLPPPTTDEATAPRTATAVFAGGCFWGVQGVFQHVTGVRSAVSGYAGGRKEDAFYERVGRGGTGHAEAVQVTYDPSVVSYGRLLQIFFSVAHDPTQLNRQGPDVGTQYRSALFPVDDAQRRIAAAYVAQLGAARAFPAPIVTKLEAGSGFFPAEAYHQNFLTLNPNHPYIVVNDLPKVEALRTMFPDRYRARPVLVELAAR